MEIIFQALKLSPEDAQLVGAALIGNWVRLKRQEEYLTGLPVWRQLAAIGMESSHPTAITTLMRRVQSALPELKAGTNTKPNILELVNIPERLQWQLDTKLKALTGSLRLGKKFKEAFAGYLAGSTMQLEDQIASFGWFNEQWNRLLQPKQPFFMVPTEQLLKRLGCFDEQDRWDEAKAQQVFDHIVARDAAWLAEVAKDRLKAPDTDF